MQNTDSSRFCSTDWIRRVRLLGQEVDVKGYICAPEGGVYRPKPENVQLQLSILPTRYCDAACSFCIAKPTSDRALIDLDALRKSLTRLKAEGCVRGISITGGEPATYFETLQDIISMIFSLFGYEMEITLDTNGTNALRLCQLPSLEMIDAIHISRHHWDDAVNQRIFGREMPSAALLKEAIAACPSIFVLNCMLLKGFVETPDDAHRYLDFAIELGAPKVSFITAAPVNEYARTHSVEFDKVLREDDERLLFTRGYRDRTYCRCRDGVYANDHGQLIEFYGRQTNSNLPCPYLRGLVIEPDGAVYAGFGGKKLYDPGKDKG